MNQAAWTAYKESVRRAEFRRRVREFLLGLLFGLAAMGMVYLCLRGA